MLDRWAIDDGYHVPRIEPDILASAKRGEDMVTVSCTCGRMRTATVPHLQRLGPHLAHLRESQRIKGSSRYLGLRLALLMLADTALFLGAQVLGDRVVPHPAGLADLAARLGFVAAGLVAAAALTVAVRHYIAPGKLPRLPEA